MQPQQITIAFLGPHGTFTEQASRRYFTGSEVIFLPCQNILSIFQVVMNGEAKFGVVPVENSNEGSVNITLDLLLEHELTVCGEVDLRIRHNLIVKPGTKMEDIRRILSHPQALAQCRKFLQSKLPWAERVDASSTARAVEMLSETKGTAAIGTELAAKINGMKILIMGIEDNPNNFTRFFVIGKEQAPASEDDKTSIVFSVTNTPGSLYRAIEEFAVRKINLTKIESRPTKRKPWEYLFYLDFEGNANDKKCREALKGLSKKASFVKVLGSYPKSSAPD